MGLFKSSPATPLALDQAGQTWFNRLRNKYQALLPSLPAPTPTQTVAKAQLDKLLALPANELRQPDLADLEDWLVVLMSGAELRQWVNLVRDDFRNIFGEESWLRTLPTLVPKVDAASDVELLAEARRLQSELHWHHSLQPWAMEKRQVLSPLQGAVFALLITLLLTAGVVTSGFIVPEVSLAGDDCPCPTNAPSGALSPLPTPVTSLNAPSPSDGLSGDSSASSSAHRTNGGSCS